MVNDAIVNLIQDTVDDIIENYEEVAGTKYFYGYTCVIHNELDYQFMKSEPNVIDANIIFGSATKNNDLEDKYNLSFVINIQSEPNGYEIGKKLFDILFKTLTRKIVSLDDYTGKIFLSSPTISNPFSAIESDYAVLLTMNGSVEFSESVVYGCKYELSMDGVNYIEVKPRTPYTLKEATGGMDKSFVDPSQMVFTKSSNQLTVNIVLIFELDGGTTETAHDTLFKKLMQECKEGTKQTYTFKESIGDVLNPSYTSTISGLICVRGQHVYNEESGENVMSLQFKVGA